VAALCRSLGGREGRPYAPQKSRSFSPQPDHTYFTRLPISTLFDSLAPGPARNEMTPDHIGQGSFLFLGFNHWVTSLSAGSTGRFMFGWNPSAAFMFFSFRMRLAFM
jgi:hypothetical protein